MLVGAGFKPAPTGLCDPHDPSPAAEPPSSKLLKFSKPRLALAFAIAGLSDVIGAFAAPLPPAEWVVDVATALLLFAVLGWQWLILPGLVLEAIPGLGVLPFWLLVCAAIAVLGTPRPTFERRCLLTRVDRPTLTSPRLVLRTPR